VIELLNGSNFGFQIYKTSDSHDKGIDFRGSWKFPQHNNSFNENDESDENNDNNNNNIVNVFGQCKHLSKPVGVSNIREFEGSLSKYNLTQTIGLFVSYSKFSIHCINYINSSKTPIILSRILCHPMRMVSFKMNQPAQDNLPHLSMFIRRNIQTRNKKIVFIR
jgi:hypothetical protein